MSSAKTVLDNRDLKRHILSMSTKNCHELTNAYRHCIPPFRYRNMVTGSVRSCYKDCYANVHIWLTLLLQSLPKTYELSMRTTCAGEKGSCKRRKVDHTVYRGTLDLFASDRHLGIDSNLVEVAWWVVDEDQDRASFAKAFDLYFPKSPQDAALYVKKLLDESPTKVFTISLPDSSLGARNDQVLSFPGNPTWQRFARLIRFGKLTFDFSGMEK